jgi:alkylation response protein AidB-like acyl-CoA dehydrogenase
MSSLKPSSATTGFFQTPPTVPPQYTSQERSRTPHDNDLALPRILALYLPSPLPAQIAADLSTFARKAVAPSVLALTASAEINQPTLHPLDSFGTPNRTDALHTSDAWRRLQNIGIEEGMVAIGYESSPGASAGAEYRINRRIHQFVKYHLWAASAALVTCPSAMTDGAAVLLGRHLGTEPGVRGKSGPGAQAQEVFREARRRLISRDPREAWTSGQWMTERTGGSDVSRTETVARQLPRQDVGGEDAAGMPLGPWRIDGFKWFSSATDADMAVLLARTEKGGLSAFYAPMKRKRRALAEGAGNREGGTEFNGVRIQRLKNKMGTKGLPTAELELSGMRGYLIGKEGEGVKEISALLNITRLHTAVSQVGYWGRGLAVSRAYAKVRKVAGGTLLADVKQHVAWMADETVKYHAAMHLTYFAVALLGASEQGPGVMQHTRARELIPKNIEEQDLLLRVLTPVVKAQTALASIHGLRACMESLGGLGYLENNDDPVLNIARLYRDANVGAIWEGTTSVLADDLIRVLKGKLALQAMRLLERWVTTSVAAGSAKLQEEKENVTKIWLSLKRKVHETDVEQLQWRGREILKELELIVCGCVMIFNASMDEDEVQIELARRWTMTAGPRVSSSADWKKDAAMDKRIFFGDESNVSAKL